MTPPLHKEVWSFLRERKKWLLAPIIILVLLLMVVLLLSRNSALAPFVYDLF